MSSRKCCLCFGHNKDLSTKDGQLAHISKDPSDSSEENLVWLCFEHHNKYDSISKQGKGITPGEVRAWREELYKHLRKELDAVKGTANLLDKAGVAEMKSQSTKENVPQPPLTESSDLRNQTVTRKPTAEEKKAMKLATGPFSQEQKIALRTLLYTTSDPYAQIQCIFGLLHFFDPRTDTIAEMLALADQGIQAAQRNSLLDAEAIFLAGKARLISFNFVEEDMQGYSKFNIGNMLGIPIINETEHQALTERLRNLQESYKALFKDAMHKAHESGNRQALAIVFTDIGFSAGQRAVHFEAHHVEDRASLEKNLCKTALLEAKTLYLSLGGEMHAAYALHELANQIRFFGETEEAKSICKEVIRIAHKHKNNKLADQAHKMLERIKSGRIPNYIAGEGD